MPKTKPTAIARDVMECDGCGAEIEEGQPIWKGEAGTVCEACQTQSEE